MENAGIIIDRISDHECYITFKRTGLVISVDDATEEELVSMLNALSVNQKYNGN